MTIIVERSKACKSGSLLGWIVGFSDALKLGDIFRICHAESHIGEHAMIRTID